MLLIFYYDASKTFLDNRDSGAGLMRIHLLMSYIQTLRVIDNTCRVTVEAVPLLIQLILIHYLTDQEKALELMIILSL